MYVSVVDGDDAGGGGEAVVDPAAAAPVVLSDEEMTMLKEAAPYIAFLTQECRHFNHLLETMETSLTSLRKHLGRMMTPASAAAGSMITMLDDEMEDLTKSLLMNIVPICWLRAQPGNSSSLPGRPLTLWFRYVCR